VMTGYALALVIAWGVESGWEPVRHLLPSLARGLAAAAAAVAIAYPLVQAMLGSGGISLLRASTAALIGGLTAVAAFLGVSYLLRSPELAELRRRRRPGPGPSVS